MTREMTLIVLGLLTMVVPYTGFPSPWRTGALVLIGATVAVVGFLMRGEELSKTHHRTNEHHPFQESARRMSDVHAVESTDISNT